MKTGFKDQNIDLSDVYITRDWLISHYPELADGLVASTGIKMYGGGWSMMGDGIVVSSTTPRAPLGTTETPSGLINDNPWNQLFERDGNAGIATKSDGSLWVWGDNGYGQLGDGTTIAKSSPIVFGSSKWIDATMVGGRTHAIRSDGALFGVGYNDPGIGGGLLGDGTTVNKSSPVQIGTSSWIAVSGSGSHTLAIRADGTLWAWGADKWAQGAAATSMSPVQIGTSYWASISAGSGISFGIRADGTLWRWGGSAYGGNGDNTNGTTTSVPTQIGTKTNWRMVSASNSSTHIIAAIDNDNNLYTWGYNGAGGLGDGTTINKSSPVQVGGAIWASVTVGISSVCAIAIDGSLWTWGDNTSSILGDTTGVSRSSPVQIASSLRFYAASFNGTNLLALTDGGVIG